MKSPIIVFLLLFTILPDLFLNAQENYFDSLFVEEIKVENPVYKPVVGIGTGVMNFIGDVNDNFRLFSSGTPGGKLTVSTYIDKKHLFKFDFYFLAGILSGNESSLDRNLNFRSQITSIGMMLHYDFGSFINNEKIAVSPFVEIGLGTLNFNSKGDLKDAQGNEYIFASDGTIHDVNGNIIRRDYKYESDLRSLNLYGLGTYSQFAGVVPIGIGFNAHLTDRTTLRIGTIMNISTTDLIDNVSHKSTMVVADKWPDMFTYSFVSLHLDLFSEPRYVKVEKMFVDYETDDVITGDEDYDLILDFADQCPVTPYGVETDSTGCPLDSDMDGVPDYLDKEPKTPQLAVVDDEGKEISDSLLSGIYEPGMAVPRSDVDHYYEEARKAEKNVLKNMLGVPLRFKAFDLNNDDYLSFDEFLQAIDKYFDYRTFLSMQDIYELMDFYFSQQ